MGSRLQLLVGVYVVGFLVFGGPALLRRSTQYSQRGAIYQRIVQDKVSAWTDILRLSNGYCGKPKYLVPTQP